MSYMDEVVMFSRTLEEHLEHLLRITLECMSNADLTVDPGKPQLGLSRVKLLVYVMDNGTVQSSDDKLKAILEYSSPHNEKRL